MTPLENRKTRVIRSGCYKLDRHRFIEWIKLTGVIHRIVEEHAYNDLSISGEYILSDTDLLKYVETVPGYLFDDVPSYMRVLYSNIKIVQNLKRINHE